MTYVLELEIPGLPRMSNASGRSRGFWALYQESKRWRATVATLVRPKRPPTPLERAKLTLTRFSSVCPDSDGLVIGFKPIIDGLVDGGVLANDRAKNIGMPSFNWIKVRPKEGRISVRVEELCERTEGEIS